VSGGCNLRSFIRLEVLPPSSGLKIIRTLKSGGMRRTGHVTCMGELRNVHKNLVGKPEGKRSLSRPRHTCEDHIKMDRKVIVWDGVNLIHLPQDKDRWRAVVHTAMNLRVTYKCRGGIP
jgi:hypothetical protein